MEGVTQLVQVHYHLSMVGFASFPYTVDTRSDLSVWLELVEVEIKIDLFKLKHEKTKQNFYKNSSTENKGCN